MDLPIHHPHKMSLAQFCAHILRELIFNFSMLTIARTTKPASATKEKAEDESIVLSHGQGAAVETEFYGGEQMQDPEDEDGLGSEAWRAGYGLDHDKLVLILCRHVEIAAASRKGRQSASTIVCMQC